MCMPIRKKKTSLQHTDQLASFGSLWLYRWSLSRTMITAPSGPYRPLFRIVSTAPLVPYSFLYPLLRFMHARNIKQMT